MQQFCSLIIHDDRWIKHAHTHTQFNILLLLTLFFTPTSAPILSSTLTTSMWPDWAAQIRGVIPYAFHKNMTIKWNALEVFTINSNVCTIILYHIISYHIISYNIITCHTLSYHIISCYIISYHIILYYIISYYITSYSDRQVPYYHT